MIILRYNINLYIVLEYLLINILYINFTLQNILIFKVSKYIIYKEYIFIIYLNKEGGIMKLINKVLLMLKLIFLSLWAGIPNLNNGCYNNLNPYTLSGYGGQCTAFAWGRACEKMNIKLKFNVRSYPSAKYWYYYGPRNYLNLRLGKEPKSNSIAIWKGDSFNPYGHVAFVEKVKNGYIYFNEANVNTYNATQWGGGYDGYEKIRSIRNFQNRGRGIGKILGYLYLDSHTEYLEVYDFWQKSRDGIYKASCFKEDWILDSQFKVKNNGNEPIYIEKLALAMHDNNNNYLFDLKIRYIYRILYPKDTLYFGIAKAYLINPSSYKLIAKAYYDNGWHNLSSLNVTVIENNECYNYYDENFSYDKNYYYSF